MHATYCMCILVSLAPQSAFVHNTIGGENFINLGLTCISGSPEDRHQILPTSIIHCENELPKVISIWFQCVQHPKTSFNFFFPLALPWSLLSLEEPSPVNHEVGPGDKAAVVAGQEGHGPGHLGRGPSSAHDSGVKKTLADLLSTANTKFWR